MDIAKRVRAPGAKDDVQVTYADQQLINKFGRLHLKLQEVSSIT